jgi:tetratricopeptide (TPR) repeat protein
MPARPGSRVLLTLPVLLFAAGAVRAQDQHQHAGTPPADVGSVRFENSCAPDVQERIGRAVALLHSFWYEAVDREFREVATADPSCAIAWWGVAMAQWQPLWEVRGPGREALARGREAVAKGLALSSGTPRERAYLSALEKFYGEYETRDHTDRVLAYEGAMTALHAAHPKDTEAAVFHALALLSAAVSLPPDKTYARQKRAGALLQPVFRAQPDHPGVAHYLIHAYDYPALAAGALDAARRYARLAPDSPHALHMPSHIFTRLGLWEDSIASNRTVVEAARKHSVPGEQLHGSDYLVFAHLQRGEDEVARQVIDAAPAIADVPKDHVMYFAGLYATASMPARYAVERRKWAEAAALPEPAGFPGGRYAWADAVVYFARALGAARTGDVKQARGDVETLARLRQTLADLREDYWAGQVEVQRTAAGAWLLFAEGKRDEALEGMRAAADLEDATDKHPVTPGQIVPARDLLAQMLLELRQPAEALAEFERVLAAEPNRFGALYGAARAAELAGRKPRARELYTALVKLAPESERPEIRHARTIIGGRP